MEPYKLDQEFLEAKSLLENLFAQLQQLEVLGSLNQSLIPETIEIMKMMFNRIIELDCMFDKSDDFALRLNQALSKADPVAALPLAIEGVVLLDDVDDLIANFIFKVDSDET